jgi:peptide/nickel transport system substrate-binding protein
MARLSAHSPRVHRRSVVLALLGAVTLLGFTVGSSSADGATFAAAKTATPATAKTAAAGSDVKSIVWAQQASNAPNCIFPLGPLTCQTVANANSFQALMYRPLYWLGQNGGAGINWSLSLAKKPVFSNHNRVVTIKLKPYKWSNGAPVTARDVVFMYNLVKANKTEWQSYSPGSFPDTVVSAKAVNASTLRLKLNKSWSPTWFLYTQLAQLLAWPVAWDITEFPAGVTATSGLLPARP